MTRALVPLLVAVLATACGGPGSSGHPAADAAPDPGTDAVPLDLPADPGTLDPGRDVADAADAADDADVADDADAPADVADAADAADVADVADDADVPDAPADDADVADAPPDAPACTLPSPFPAVAGWTAPNTWSWDGSWTPAADEFPMAGLLDPEYGDGHLVEGQPTPVLPPGLWDWDDDANDVANWRNFAKNIGSFAPLRDGCDRQYGWRLVGNVPGAIDFGGAAEYFLGSPGVDLLALGPAGKLHGIAGSLGDGPDVLVFKEAWSLDYRTGSSLDGARHDDDLVIAGCTTQAPGTYTYHQASIHMGPGADLAFLRDMGSAAIDAGNGAGGDTSVIDPDDGDDVVVLRGNMKDFRFFGGRGDDVAVWYLDEQGEKAPFFAPDFFGGGGAGDAIWGDPGTDRLVLVIPPDTPILHDAVETPAGAIRLWTATNETVVYVEPSSDPYAKYCVTCGRSPDGRWTLQLEYRSADDAVFTGYVSVTAIEELQLGLGPDAKVYRLDDREGTATLDPALVPFEPPAFPAAYCAL